MADFSQTDCGAAAVCNFLGALIVVGDALDGMPTDVSAQYLDGMVLQCALISRSTTDAAQVRLCRYIAAECEHLKARKLLEAEGDLGNAETFYQELLHLINVASEPSVESPQSMPQSKT